MHLKSPNLEVNRRSHWWPLQERGEENLSSGSCSRDASFREGVILPRDEEEAVLEIPSVLKPHNLSPLTGVLSGSNVGA